MKLNLDRFEPPTEITIRIKRPRPEKTCPECGQPGHKAEADLRPGDYRCGFADYSDAAFEAGPYGNSDVRHVWHGLHLIPVGVA